MKIVYRLVTEQDAEAIHDIYQHYVDHTAITFQTVNAEVQDYAEKIRHNVYPFWVAEVDGEVMGFAYAERLRPKEAYIWDVELTIYLRSDAPKRQGIGGELYERLLKDLAEAGFRNAYGVITGSNQSSIDFHLRFGFTQVAHFPKMGYKHGVWHDVVWLHKAIGCFEGVPELPVPFRKSES